jgi:hypothetical protein
MKGEVMLSGACNICHVASDIHAEAEPFEVCNMLLT